MARETGSIRSLVLVTHVSTQGGGESNNDGFVGKTRMGVSMGISRPSQISLGLYRRKTAGDAEKPMHANAGPQDRVGIGESSPMLFTRRIVCRFTQSEHEEYDRLSQQPRQDLARFLPDGRLCWNKGAARKLILLSPFPPFLTTVRFSSPLASRRRPAFS